jgi:hypothetical protein
MRIPNADAAIVAEDKIVQYLLNLDHPDGGSKAAMLARAGCSADRPREFELALRNQHLPLEATLGRSSAYGEKYEIVGALEGPKGRVLVRSIWIIRHGERFPRLITLIPEKQE